MISINDKLPFEAVFLAAWEYEIKGLFDLSKFDCQNLNAFRQPVWFHHDKAIAIFSTGIGTIHAAMATANIINYFSPKQIINVGLAGAVNSNLELASVHPVSTVRMYDVDARAFNYRVGQIPQTDLVEYKLGCDGLKLACGNTFCTNLAPLAGLIEDGFNADLIDMESGGIAVACQGVCVPQIFKIVSDYVNADSKTNYYNEAILFKQGKEFTTDLINRI